MAMIFSAQAERGYGTRHRTVQWELSKETDPCYRHGVTGYSREGKCLKGSYQHVENLLL